MLVRIVRSVTVIRKEQNELKFLIKKQKKIKKNRTREQNHVFNIKLLPYVHCLFSILFSILLRASAKASLDFCMYDNRMLTILPRTNRFS